MDAMQGTGNLISSEKVEGTNVYNRTGDTLGSIHDLMIDKPRVTSFMRSCHSGASWEWAINITLFRGRS
jgi:hypothetical protein